MRVFFLFIFVGLARGTLSKNLFSPCQVSDSTCIEDTVNAAIPLLFKGIPELGVDSSDGVFLETINASQPILNFIFHNTTMFGLGKTRISNLKFHEDITSLRSDVLCTGLSMNGTYELDGLLITEPIQGKGNFKFSIDAYYLTFYFRIKKVEGVDGKTHLYLNNFTFDALPVANAKHEFENLFDGRKDLANEVRKFVKENWKEVAAFIQQPIWNTIIRKVISNVNKYLETIPLDELLLL